MDAVMEFDRLLALELQQQQFGDTDSMEVQNTNPHYMTNSNQNFEQHSIDYDGSQQQPQTMVPNKYIRHDDNHNRILTAQEHNRSFAEDDPYSDITTDDYLDPSNVINHNTENNNIFVLSCNPANNPITTASTMESESILSTPQRTQRQLERYSELQSLFTLPVNLSQHDIDVLNVSIIADQYKQNQHIYESNHHEIIEKQIIQESLEKHVQRMSRPPQSVGFSSTSPKRSTLTPRHKIHTYKLSPPPHGSPGGYSSEDTYSPNNTLKPKKYVHSRLKKLADDHSGRGRFSESMNGNDSDGEYSYTNSSSPARTQQFGSSSSTVLTVDSFEEVADRMKADIKQLVQETIRRELHQSVNATPDKPVSPRSRAPSVEDANNSNNSGSSSVVGNLQPRARSRQSSPSRKDSLTEVIERKVSAKIAQLKDEIELLKLNKQAIPKPAVTAASPGQLKSIGHVMKPVAHTTAAPRRNVKQSTVTKMLPVTKGPRKALKPPQVSPKRLEELEAKKQHQEKLAQRQQELEQLLEDQVFSRSTTAAGSEYGLQSAPPGSHQLKYGQHAYALPQSPMQFHPPQSQPQSALSSLSPQQGPRSQSPRFDFPDSAINGDAAVHSRQGSTETGRRQQPQQQPPQQQGFYPPKSAASTTRRHSNNSVTFSDCPTPSSSAYHRQDRVAPFTGEATTTSSRASPVMHFIPEATDGMDRSISDSGDLSPYVARMRKTSSNVNDAADPERMRSSSNMSDRDRVKTPKDSSRSRTNSAVQFDKATMEAEFELSALPVATPQTKEATHSPAPPVEATQVAEVTSAAPVKPEKSKFKGAVLNVMRRLSTFKSSPDVPVMPKPVAVKAKTATTSKEQGMAANVPVAETVKPQQPPPSASKSALKSTSSPQVDATKRKKSASFVEPVVVSPSVAQSVNKPSSSDSSRVDKHSNSAKALQSPASASGRNRTVSSNLTPLPESDTSPPPQSQSHQQPPQQTPKGTPKASRKSHRSDQSIASQLPQQQQETQEQQHESQARERRRTKDQPQPAADTTSQTREKRDSRRQKHSTASEATMTANNDQPHEGAISGDEVAALEVEYDRVQETIANLNKAKSKVKKFLKTWVADFEAQNGRPPTTEDKLAIEDSFLNYKQITTDFDEAKTYSNSVKDILEKIKTG